MKEVSANHIKDQIARLCIEAACELPGDVEDALRQAALHETSECGRWALGKIEQNIEIAKQERMPLCQDCGLVVVFVDIGQDVRIVDGSLEHAIQAGVEVGYRDGYLRKSIVDDPLFERINTETNTPAFIHYRVTDGDSLIITVLPKGGGSENMSQLGMLKPADGLEGVVDFVVQTVVQAGGNPCPPTIVGVGIGGNAEYALLLSKRALNRTLGTRNPHERYAKLEHELLERINASGVGPQGLGGNTTALDVCIEFAPTHIAMLPVGVSLNCHVARHKQVVL